ncbi:MULTISPECIES: phage tail tape measure protein [Clostridium]|uniref:phage tail tape measure protein n=1 Tax=Clostridium TaxID=1485 RepID=UPI00290191A6|nr:MULTISPECIES: phage tail tape measure protein [Clostridium]MDU1229878.1 phage tail tape measure protein [Clostridium sp.]
MKLSSLLLAFSGYSVRVAMHFEESMSNVVAFSGATSDDLEKLSDTAKEMGASISKSAKESAIGGKTQLDTLQALLSGLNEEYVDLKATITDSDGVLNKLSETMQDNAKGNMIKLKSQLEGLGIQIGNYLLPHINSLLEHLSNLITWFGNLDESAQKSTVHFGFRTFVGGGLLKGIGSLTQKK